MIARIVPSVGVGLIAAVALAACGGTKLSGDSIEKLLVEDLGNRGYAGLEVACPDVDNEVGKTFTCDVTGSDEFTKIEGSVAQDDQVNVDRVS